MQIDEVIEQLQIYNDWRRGGEGEQPNPKFIGILIEEAIKHLKEKSK